MTQPDFTLKSPSSSPVSKSTNGGFITSYEVTKDVGGEMSASGNIYFVVLSAEIAETFEVNDDTLIGISQGTSENPQTKITAEAVGASDWSATMKVIPDDQSVEVLPPMDLSSSSNSTNLRITKGYSLQSKETKKLKITFDIKGNETVVVKNLDLLPVEFITPAGDPVAQPKDTGDGQNEFTFDSAKPGVLEINLKVKVAGIGGMSADIQNKFLFEIDAIGNSQMQWDAANPGGNPSFNGDFITAKVKFTGLPKNNSDFGKKMARIKFDGIVAGEEDFEVFFDKTAENHPSITAAKEPNWFLYWKKGSVCGIPLDTIY